MALVTVCCYLGLVRPERRGARPPAAPGYEAALSAYDAEGAMALLAHDYRGWGETGREGVARMVGWMRERESAFELDLTGAVVQVDGDTATVSEVGSRMGQWQSKATYVLRRTPTGWRIQSIRGQR